MISQILFVLGVISLSICDTLDNSLRSEIDQLKKENEELWNTVNYLLQIVTIHEDRFKYHEKSTTGNVSMLYLCLGIWLTILWPLVFKVRKGVTGYS